MGHYDDQRDAERSFVVGVCPKPSKPPIAMEPATEPPPMGPGSLVFHASAPLPFATFAPHWKPPQPPAAPVKSDGGSSSYYRVTIRNREGQSLTCETGDIIRALVANDFDLGNIIKACRRISESLQGRGKAGASISYDLNKIEYSINEIRSADNVIR